jgi:hypothetical protein
VSQVPDNDKNPPYTIDQQKPLPSDVAKSIASDDDIVWDTPSPTAPTPAGQDDDIIWDKDKYGTIGQQALTVGEALGQGAIGPLATGAEAGLTKLGVPGLTPEEQEARAKANPLEHYGSELAGFVGAAIATRGLSAKASLAGVVGRVGEAAVAGAAKLAAPIAAKIGISAPIISKIASAGIRTGAEMAALQASDEVSKAINADPNQSIGSAAANIGWSGLYGVGGGAALGGLGALARGAIEKSGASKIIDDAKARYNFRQSVPEGDVHQAVVNEVGTRLNELDNIGAKFEQLKGSDLNDAMPEVSPSNDAKINGQINNISSNLTNSINSASDNAYLKSGVPGLKQDFQDFLTVAKDPTSTYADKFDAINNLKKSLDSNARYSLTANESKFGQFSKNLANDLRPMLEDSNVWGSAGTVQKESNRLYSEFSNAQKDAIGKLATPSNVAGGYVADPKKITTLVNQAQKGTAGLRSDFIDSYIKSGDRLADRLNQTFVSQGLEAPIALTPTPALNTVLNTPASAGTKLGDYVYDKGLATLAGHAGGSGIGTSLGALAGHPVIGGLVGEKLLAPVITTMAKPLLENATRATAVRSTIDYLTNVIKGGNAVSKATSNVFKQGAEVLSNQAIPKQSDRDKVEKSLAYYNEDPNRLLNVAGELGHYLPEHATAAGQIAMQGINYLNSLQPKLQISNPLDAEPPIDKADQAKYDRALDIAEQPLMSLHHLSKGTLLPEDVQSIQIIYPGLYKQMVSQLNTELVNAKAENVIIPYKQRLQLAMFTGTPLDSTMTSQSMRTIMLSSLSKQPQQQQQGKQQKTSEVAINQINKVTDLYKTPLEARAESRRA